MTSSCDEAYPRRQPKAPASGLGVIALEAARHTAPKQPVLASPGHAQIAPSVFALASPPGGACSRARPDARRLCDPLQLPPAPRGVTARGRPRSDSTGRPSPTGGPSTFHSSGLRQTRSPTSSPRQSHSSGERSTLTTLRLLSRPRVCQVDRAASADRALSPDLETER